MDTRDSSVTIIRPLRMFEVKELAYYNLFHSLDVVSFESPKENNGSYIQSLIEKFVGNLQMNFPSTISTIVRTGDKLSTPNGVGTKCKLCQVDIFGNCIYKIIFTQLVGCCC